MPAFPSILVSYGCFHLQYLCFHLHFLLYLNVNLHPSIRQESLHVSLTALVTSHTCTWHHHLVTVHRCYPVFLPCLHLGNNLTTSASSYHTWPIPHPDTRLLHNLLLLLLDWNWLTGGLQLWTSCCCCVPLALPMAMSLLVWSTRSSHGHLAVAAYLLQLPWISCGALEESLTTATGARGSLWRLSLLLHPVLCLPNIQHLLQFLNTFSLYLYIFYSLP